MTGTVTKGAAFRQDFDNYDGISTASSRIDSTGGTVTGLKVGNVVDVLTVYGGGANRTRSTLAAAINAVGSNEVAFVLAPGSWVIDDDLTIPSNITLECPRGVDIQRASGKTITFSGKDPLAGPYRVFSGDGSVSGLREPMPEWFGAAADGNTTTKTGTDDRDAFQDAITAATATGGKVVFSGNYYLSDYLQMAEGVSFKGIGYGDNSSGSTLIAAGHLFQFTGEDDIKFSNFRVLGTDASTGSAFHFVSGITADVHVDRVWVQNQHNATYIESTATLVDISFETCNFISNRSWHADVENLATITNLFFTKTKFDAQNNTNNAGHFRAAGPLGYTYFNECLFQSASSTYSISTAGNAYMTFFGGMFFNNANDSQGVIDAGADVLLAAGNALVEFNNVKFLAPKSTATNFYHVRIGGATWAPKVIIKDPVVALDTAAGFIFASGSSTYPYNIEVSNAKFIGTPPSTPYDALDSAGSLVRRYNNDQDSDIYRLTKNIVKTLTTTDDTTTTIAGSTYTIEPSTHYLVTYEVIGRETDAAGTEYGAYNGAQLWDSAADRTLTSLGTLYSNQIESSAGLSVSIIAISSGAVNAGILIRVRGLVATTMQWVAKIRIMAVGTGTFPL